MLQHIPVDGGELVVDVRTATTTPVLALHGVSSNRELWRWVRAAAPEISFIAPDLRGRADSIDLPGPYSVRKHTEDLVRVLDALSLDAVTVCGMSMGGFVGVDLATVHPDRVANLVLVDGGFPMPGNAQLRPEMVPAAFAPQLAAIDREWPDPEEYIAANLAANSLLSPEDPLLRTYLTHFITDGRLRLSKDALLADATDVFFGQSRWRELTVPTWFLHAEWSVDRDTPPAYSPEVAKSFHAALDTMAPPRRIPGVDHGGTVMTPAGAAAVAEVLREIS